MSISINTLCEKMKKEKYYIYGTGFVAERFVEVIKDWNLCGNFEGFITTDGKEEKYKGQKVISILTAETEAMDSLICIAVHESNAIDIKKKLQEKGLNNSVWIYPLIFDLWYGTPIVKSVPFNINKILDSCADDYRIPVRLLAIENYFKKNNVGYSIYKKAIALHSSVETADKRLIRFIDLISSWDKHGYDTTSVIKIDQDNNVFDGVHRLALAYYFEIKEIRCDIYSTKGKREYINDEVKLTEDIISKIDFSKEEKKVLDDCYRLFKKSIKSVK